MTMIPCATGPYVDPMRRVCRYFCSWMKNKHRQVEELPSHGADKGAEA